MKEIYVLPDKLDDMAGEFKDIANHVSGIEKSFRIISKSLDWQIKSQSSIIKYIDTLSKHIDNAEYMLKKHYDFLQNAKNMYLDVEQKEREEAENLKNNLFNILKNANKTPANNILKFSDYEIYVKKLIMETSKKWFESYIDTYGAIWKNAVLGETKLRSSLLLYSGYSELTELYNKYKNGISSIPAYILDYTKTSLNIFEELIDTAFAFDNFLKTQKGLKILDKGSTFLGKFCKFIPIINVGIDMAIQGFESYEKYKDGGITALEGIYIGTEVIIKGFFSSAETALISSGIGVGAGIALMVAEDAFDLSGKTSALIENTDQFINENRYNIKSTMVRDTNNIVDSLCFYTFSSKSRGFVL